MTNIDPSQPSGPPPPSGPEPLPVTPPAPTPSAVPPATAGAPEPRSPGGSSGIDLSSPQRQSPIAALFLVLGFVRSIGIFQIVIAGGFILSRSPSILALAIGVLIVGSILLGIALLGWWRYTFSVQEGELRVENGVLSRHRLTLPLDRIQSVSIEQKFLHRLVGLVEVTADSAGTATSEFRLQAVQREVAEALQSVASDYRTATAVADTDAAVDQPVLGADGQSVVSAPAPAVEERVIVRRTPRELIKIALTFFPLTGLAVLAPLIAIGDDLREFIPFDAPEITVNPGLWLLWFVPLAIVAVLLVGLLLNIGSSFLRNWDLTVTQTAAGLRRNAGLLSKTSTASSIPRLQIIRVSQNWVARMVGIRTVSLVGVNSAVPGQTGGAGGGTVVVPGSSAKDAEELRKIALDGATGVPELDRLIHPIDTFRETRNITFMIIPVIVGLFFVVAWWPLLLLLLIPWRWAIVRRQTRLRRWGFSDDAIADRRELFGVTTNETLLRKINTITIRQAYFEKTRDLATISFVLAGGNVTIGSIPLADAKALRDRALYVAETDRRAFM